MIKPTLVTFTGADDSITAQAILDVAKDYPDTEWGILFGADDGGSRRFPSRGWIETNLPKLKGLNLSAHLCGRWVYDLVLRGDFTWLYHYPDEITSLFKRVQINFHGQNFGSEALSFHPRIAAEDYQFIFQDDEVNLHIAGDLGGTKNVRLHDMSHGSGALPKEGVWPKRTFKEYVGYAGGLGPDNIQAQLKLIEAAAQPEVYGPYWIDMETKVRSVRDSIFDMKKVRTVCEKVWD